MNTNMTGLRWLKIFASCALDESSLSIGRVKVDRGSEAFPCMMFNGFDLGAIRHSIFVY